MPLREGVTILAGSDHRQSAAEADGHGVFTRLVLTALEGGAADVRGHVTAASIYHYVDQALGPWDQRPLCMLNAAHLPVIRQCRPEVEDAELRRLDNLFESRDGEVVLASLGSGARARMERLMNANLVHFRPRGKAGETVAVLSPQGRFYWELAFRKAL
jgi:hypothetical protein